MAKKPQMVVMSYRDIATALVKAQGIHEGHWRIYLRFGEATGLNARLNNSVRPAVLVPVLDIGLMRDDVPSDLTVDAEVVNPLKRIIMPGVHPAFQ